MTQRDNSPTMKGEYIGAHWDTEELLLEVVGLDLPRDNDEKLLTELLGRLEDITMV